MMTEKRFTFIQDTLVKADVFDGDEFVCCTLSVWVEQLVDLLNQLNDENEQLKEAVWSWSHSYKIVYEQKEQLKQQLDYIQNSISEHIKHQKTELGQNTLKEIIEDYNEWLLGHKELQ